MLTELLSQKKAVILDKWFHAVLETYPEDTAKFLKKEKDRFANPVRHAVLRGIEGLYEALIKGEDPPKVNEFLENIIKIRSVQDFSPSQAINFIFFLKKIINETLGKEIHKKQLYKEMLDLEARIDTMGLMAFDVYLQCREKIYELRINEVKSQKEFAFRLMGGRKKRAGKNADKHIDDNIEKNIDKNIENILENGETS